MCRRHLDYYKQAARKWREKHIAQGLCGACGKRPLLTKALCRECNSKGNERAKKNRIVVCTLCAVKGHHRREHKKLGLCWHCKNKARGGLCKFHREEARLRACEKAQKARTQRQKAGVCLRCGAPSQGKTLCPKHLRYMAKWQAEYRSRLLASTS